MGVVGEQIMTREEKEVRTKAGREKDKVLIRFPEHLSQSCLSCLCCLFRSRRETEGVKEKLHG